MKKPNLHRALLAALIAMILIPGSQALAANPTGLEHLPRGSEMVVGVDVANSRDTKLFKEVLKVLRSDPAGSMVLAGLALSADFVLERDVEYVLLAFPESNIDPARSKKVPVTIVLRGRFDQTKINALLERRLKDKENNKGQSKLSRSKVGKRVVWSIDRAQFGFVDKNTLLLSAGPRSYRKSSWKAVGSKKRSLASNKDLMGLMDAKYTSRHMWMVADTSKLEEKMRKEAAKKAGKDAKKLAKQPQMKNIIVGVNYKGSLKLDGRAQIDSEDNAKKLVGELAEAMKQNKDQLILSMVGAEPLMENMRFENKNDQLLLSSTMKKGELNTMISKLAMMFQQPKRRPPVKKSSPGKDKKPSEALQGSEAAEKPKK